MVYLVTCRSSATYCEANNQVLRKLAKARGNVRLIDWYAPPGTTSTSGPMARR